MFWLSIGLTVLEMMYPTKIVPFTLGPVLSGKLGICIEENVVVLRYMPDEAGTHADHLFAATGDIAAIDLRVGHLFEVIPVYAKTQMLRQHLIFGGVI